MQFGMDYKFTMMIIAESFCFALLNNRRILGGFVAFFRIKFAYLNCSIVLLLNVFIWLCCFSLNWYY